MRSDMKVWERNRRKHSTWKNNINLWKLYNEKIKDTWRWYKEKVELGRKVYEIIGENQRIFLYLYARGEGFQC